MPTKPAEGQRLSVSHAIATSGRYLVVIHCRPSFFCDSHRILGTSLLHLRSSRTSAESPSMDGLGMQTMVTTLSLNRRVFPRTLSKCRSIRDTLFRTRE
ncbi:hypothetical protein CDAR_398621 [Caerostris darwini]|uniref:Uncharacterized protein n=1 Tax=Caerostris darwini TaxID=1538125 RepID=A0AAV4VF44_9ARAC|nr:hypothetical protein CDAR_398621 [Caerostris darwini]